LPEWLTPWLWFFDPPLFPEEKYSVSKEHRFRQVRRGLQPTKKIGHFHGRHSGSRSGVALLGAGPLDGLLKRFTGEHAENRRGHTIEIDLADASTDLLTDHLIMGSLAANHGSQTQDGNVFSTVGQLAGYRGYFYCSRDPDHGELFIFCAMPLKTVNRPPQQAGCDKLIKAAYHNGILAAAGSQLTFDFLYHVFRSDPDNSVFIFTFAKSGFLSDEPSEGFLSFWNFR
jgi:hypothetical protein